MTNIQEIIRQFYADVDHENWEEAMALYDPEVTYERVEPGQKRLIGGIEELKTFYTKIRDMRGRHDILDIQETSAAVLVNGLFTGMKGGAPIKLSYIDEFVLNAQQKVISRKSVIKFAD